VIEIVETEDAPKAIGPYSQAVKASGLVFASGQIAIDPSSGELLSGPVEEQADRVLTNLAAVLEAAGTTMRKVIKTTVFLSDMGDFPKVNEVYAKHFGDHKPARACIQAAALPKGVAVEIDAIAEQ
jgi:2-iminobutanoate/2-iminopropanoate deaminase